MPSKKKLLQVRSSVGGSGIYFGSAPGRNMDRTYSVEGEGEGEGNRRHVVGAHIPALMGRDVLLFFRSGVQDQVQNLGKTVVQTPEP